MKRFFVFLVLGLSALFLAACASSAPQKQSPTGVDNTYVGAVNHHASRAGVRVVWVNPPKKKVDTEARDQRR